MKTVIKTVIVMVLLVVFGGIIYIYSGSYNVAATIPDSSLAHWVMKTTRESSIESRLDNITPPDEATLSDPKTIRIGFEHYNEMCLVCHGAPGVEAGEAREGLNPRPPLLAKVADKVSTKEMFWIIKNGIKYTGMPAWGPTHDDNKIWAMVAFVKTLPKLSPEEFKIMQKASATEKSHMDHELHEHTH